MAKLINGNGNPAVYAAEDADWFAAIMGNQTSITGIGEQFRADQADANTIEVFDGVIITKEGRRIQLDANAVDLFEIPTGVPGTTSYYIIGYHLYNDENSNQFCEVFTQKMDTASETIPEDTFRGGADEIFVSLYRVTQDGLTITDIDLLLSTIGSIKEAEEFAEDKIGTESGAIGIYNTQTIEKISYDNTNKNLILKVNGADTPVPFNGGFTPQYTSGSNGQSNSFTLNHDTTIGFFSQSIAGVYYPRVIRNGTALTLNTYTIITTPTGSYGLFAYYFTTPGGFKKGDIVTVGAYGGHANYTYEIIA